MTYVVINGLIWLIKVASFGRIVPDDADQKEYWTYKPAGNLPWFVRIVQDPKHVFQSKPADEELDSSSQGGSVEVEHHIVDVKA
jgi:AGZA family xanthine/uracil permease-like MFS transporter